LELEINFVGMVQTEVYEKVLEGERLSPEEALSLFEEDITVLGYLANEARKRHHPQNIATFVIDRNVNYTNVCVAGCKFCAFQRKVGSPEGYVLPKEEILKKAGWESETYHIIPPIHTDVVLDYGESEKKAIKEEIKAELANYHELANFIRYLGGLELEELNYFELIYDKVEPEVQDLLDQMIRTQRRILGKLFGIFYTVDPLMAEAILTIKPERIEFLKSLTVKETVRNKEFNLYSNLAAWNIVKDRIASRFPEVSHEEVENYKGRREEFVKLLMERTRLSRESVERALEECGWLKTEEIPPFLRQIGP